MALGTLTSNCAQQKAREGNGGDSGGSLPQSETRDHLEGDNGTVAASNNGGRSRTAQGRG
jgi:hypothetical protein